MEHGAPKRDIDFVLSKIEERSFRAHPSIGVERTIIGVIGDNTRDSIPYFQQLPGVESVIPVLKPYKLASREAHPQTSQIRVGSAVIGTEAIAIAAGPCAVEDREQLLSTARLVKDCGAVMLRGGAYKPRTEAYAFQGLGKKGLEMLAEAREQTGLAVVTEVVDTRAVKEVAKYADMLQIGARSMQNFALLREAGASGHPVLLKRGLASTVDEWLSAAEYILAEGNPNVVLCERGIRTFETATRFTLDLSSVAVVRHHSHLPILVDPSHAAGNWRFVRSLALAAIAAGADGLLIEVHPEPARALVDGAQSLDPDNFRKLMSAARKVAKAVGRAL
jgi:3-deoxy-7-phosphoheptulonate synthase